ncbi:MAG: decaprenyl-phosphate phosphoribosyltransferase [Kiritimatiellae bacterium]|jgi:4-hydroxybenzoate polyprenyltransferase|nr:decaprenyl-phosphate phosphoribosyltransferase [Kiritimatiellia bacterium]
MNLNDMLTELRPRQWTKSLVVLAAFLFALGDKQQHVSLSMAGLVFLAMILFAITSSGVYVWNDIKDIALDRAHPVKCRRPVAAGKITVPTAVFLACLCLFAGLAGAWLITPRFGMVVTGYVLLQAAYTLYLKRLPLVDVFVIAFGFIMRAVAGAVAINVVISPWLLICTFLMALFLALCKRRHEKRLMADGQQKNFRPSLEDSDERLLDQLIAITAGAVIIAYAVYTQWPETVEKFQTTNLSLTIPFVIFGIFRYLYLVYGREKGGQPESILLTDLPLLADVILFGMSIVALVVI